MHLINSHACKKWHFSRFIRSYTIFLPQQLCFNPIFTLLYCFFKGTMLRIQKWILPCVFLLAVLFGRMVSGCVLFRLFVCWGRRCRRSRWGRRGDTGQDGVGTPLFQARSRSAAMTSSSQVDRRRFGGHFEVELLLLIWDLEATEIQLEAKSNSKSATETNISRIGFRDRLLLLLRLFSRWSRTAFSVICFGCLITSLLLLCSLAELPFVHWRLESTALLRFKTWLCF